MNVLRGENRFGFRGQLTLDFPRVAKLVRYESLVKMKNGAMQ